MTLDQILDAWQKDCRIDPNSLDISSQQTPELHAKYLGLLSKAKLRLKDAEFKQKELMKYKWLWFHGKFDGLKILKGDMEHFVEADTELVASEAKIEYLKTMIDTLKEIVDNLKWRHQTVGNIIRWKQFEAGF